jgi:hypothetical protein
MFVRNTEGILGVRHLVIWLVCFALVWFALVRGCYTFKRDYQFLYFWTDFRTILVDNYF